MATQCAIQVGSVLPLVLPMDHCGGNLRYAPEMAVPSPVLLRLSAAAAWIASGTNVAPKFGACKCKTQTASIRYLVRCVNS